MSSNLPVVRATSDEAVLAYRVQEALGELVGQRRKGCRRALSPSHDGGHENLPVGGH